MNDPSAPRPTVPPPLWLLVMVTLNGTLAMHMFMPALPEAARALQASPGAMQMSVSIYIVGLAVGQLFYGPVSDTLGRRSPLMAGLALYTAGGVACALAPDLPTLLAGRLVQALGGCAGLALGRAIVRDTTTPETAVRGLALLNVMILAGPGVAPMVGGALAHATGWRGIFVALAVAGAVTLLLTWRLLPETSRSSRRFSPASLLQDYGTLLRSRRFAGLALGGGCATTSSYAFLSAAPFIFVDVLHQPVHRVGIYAGLMVVGMALGNLLTGRLAHRLGAPRMLRIGGALTLGGAVALLATDLAGALSVPGTIVLMLVYTCGCGIASPLALAGAMSVDPQRAGSAAGLYGCAQMAIGAACTALAAVGHAPARSALLVMLGATLIAQAAFAWARRAG